MSPKRLVLLVEGQGEVDAAPVLVDRLLKEYHAAKPVFDVVCLDRKPFLVGEFSKIRRNRKDRRIHDFGEWRRLLQAAVTSRRNVGGCILLLDGDSPISVEGHEFCAARAAKILAAEAQKVGAGTLFSLAVVFACMEFESWLIAGVKSLENQSLADGRPGIRMLPREFPENPEMAPRDAKGWFRRIMAMGYKPTRDQAELTRLVDLNVIRNGNLRSFRRLESAIDQLVTAIRSGNHTVTPTS
jgi:hypothetical protein